MKFTSTTVFTIIATILIVYLAYQLYTYVMGSEYRISAAEARKLLREKQFDIVLDVRTALERETVGYYPGSLHMPSADIPKKMPELFPNKSTRVLVYCNNGPRARAATDKLHELGYKNAVYIASGHGSLME